MVQKIKKKIHVQFRRHWKLRFNPWVRKISWRRAWQPTFVFFPGESQGQRSLEGYSPKGHKESATTEQLITSMCVCVCVCVCAQALKKKKKKRANACS